MAARDSAHLPSAHAGDGLFLINRIRGWLPGPDRLAVRHPAPPGRWRDGVAGMRNAPPFAVWRLWLGRPVRADRAPFLGTSAFGALDHVSVVERFEAAAATWSKQHGGSVVELHAYALPEAVSEPEVQQMVRLNWVGFTPNPPMLKSSSRSGWSRTIARSSTPVRGICGPPWLRLTPGWFSPETAFVASCLSP